MKSLALKCKILVLFSLVAIYGYAAYAESLTGKVGSSSQYGSGWIDLKPVKSFKAGDKLRLKIGGTAKKIVVRLLPRGDDSNDPIGIVETDLTVPKSRVVTVTLKEDHLMTIQISVHGGPKPWTYSLGEGNGPATLEKAERLDP
jgi:hypothetical protein